MFKSSSGRSRSESRESDSDASTKRHAAAPIIHEHRVSLPSGEPTASDRGLDDMMKSYRMEFELNFQLATAGDGFVDAEIKRNAMSSLLRLQKLMANRNRDESVTAAAAGIPASYFPSAPVRNQAFSVHGSHPIPLNSLQRSRSPAAAVAAVAGGSYSPSDDNILLFPCQLSCCNCQDFFPSDQDKELCRMCLHGLTTHQCDEHAFD